LALLGEAHLLRALYYYHLVQLFGDIPYMDHFVSDPSEVLSVSKTPAAKVYEHIITDCEYAIANLPDTYTNNNKARPSKGAAQTLLSSVYMILKRWDSAAKLAETVINDANKYQYALVKDYN